MSIEAMKQALEALESSRQTHHYCEDTWYSCPKHEEGCANEAEGDECNCGAEEVNAVIDAAITSLRQAIAEAEKQEPVAWQVEVFVNNVWTPLGNPQRDKERAIRLANNPDIHKECQRVHELYTSPPQRQPLTDEEAMDAYCETPPFGTYKEAFIAGIRLIEAAHGIKGEA